MKSLDLKQIGLQELSTSSANCINGGYSWDEFVDDVVSTYNSICNWLDPSGISE